MTPSLACLHCDTNRETGSKFCPECGLPLNVATRAANAEHARLVADGQRLFGEGRTSEAVLLASAVLEQDPDHAPALALQGDCFERDGRTEDALECYERVVALRPESPLNRIRVAQLRKSLTQEALAASPAGNRRTALLAAAAAVVLVVAAGSALVLATRGPSDTVVASQAPETVATATPFQSPAPVPSGQPGSPGQAPGQPTSDPAAAADQQSNGGLPAATTSPAPANPPRIVGRPNPSVSSSLGGLPSVSGSALADGGYRPWNPFANVVPDSTVPASPPATSDPEPVASSQAPDPPAGPSTGDGGADAPGQPAGIVDIRPSAGNPTSVGGSSTVQDGANQVEALVRSARDAYLRGDYARAASLYESALRAGASRGSTNQRLAQAYEKLGRKTDAIAAYRRALGAYESQLAAGGDQGRLEAAIAAVKQALRVLGG